MEHHSTERKLVNNNKRHLTVYDDHIILQSYKKLKTRKDFSLEKVAEEVQKKIPDLTTDTISDRVSTYFIGMYKVDEDKISKSQSVYSHSYRKIQPSTFTTRKLLKERRLTTQ